MPNNVKPPLQRNHLDIQGALLKIGDPSALRDLVFMLTNLLTQDVPAITHAVNTGDFPEVASRLHSLKGCLPIFCTSDICAQVVAAELTAKQGLVSETAQVFANLCHALEHLKSEANEYLTSPC